MSERLPGRPRFGVRIGGVAVALPEGLQLAYLERVAVMPLPGAPPAVVGLAQVNSHPVVVVDPSGSRAIPVPARCSVLVAGEPSAAAGLVVDGPPAPVELGEPLPGRAPPDCAFATLLADPVADAGNPDLIWWSVHPAELCRRLAAGEPV
jgi:hypothetical protein